ncbi:hypothetical protein HanXRQr2_Chr13g0569841 [Helianthus annuus]|uniref:Uncharacterized protein n=1 Tax=Helianthus annuus TaxID=4232 RepID=A0A251SN58_HELAN|nr:uncharacterized protein LOC110897494 [Helianthus annuus]KAF5771861.1 hypothetical protein HanXRQr2_Chr13g0569841 [Helianthus annuus]KAJ0847736.1 hypothetical protein HanPSC8_Chr13g0548691 [Helianthus annuus]
MVVLITFRRQHMAPMRMMMSKRLKMVMLMSMMVDDDVISPVGFTAAMAAVFTRQTSWARWPDSHSGTRINIWVRSTLVNGAGSSLVLGQRQSTGQRFDVRVRFRVRVESVIPESTSSNQSKRVNSVDSVNSVNASAVKFLSDAKSQII